MKPKPFNVLLTADQRAKLEAHRAAFGLRSEGDAIRHLIEHSIDIIYDLKGLKAGRAVSAALEPSVTEEDERRFNAKLALGPVTPKPGSRLKKR